MQGVKNEIPFRLKEDLVRMSKRIPTERRADFLVSSANKLGELALEHPRTLVFGIAGLVIGELIDNLLTFNIPLSKTVVSLTGDHAGLVGLIGGGAYGFIKDRESKAVKMKIAQIIKEQIIKSMED